MTARDSFTPYQKALIKQASALGYGYAIFAHNVERQGWCSTKQEEALARMVDAGTYRKNNWRSSGHARGSRRKYEPEGDSPEQYAEGESYDSF